MQLKITINMECSNDAFHPMPAQEAMRIINDGTMRQCVGLSVNEAILSQAFASLGRVLRDSNGNSVGRVEVEVKP